MKQRPIRVIKRTIPAREHTAAAITANKVIDTESDTVNTWIVEHREIRRIEKVFSDERIRAWKSMPGTSA